MNRKLKVIDGLFDEIDYLRKKAELLDEMLKFYDKGCMAFFIPPNWHKGFSVETMTVEELKKTPYSPRHALNEKISKLLPYSECEPFVNWEELEKTAEDLLKPNQPK
jgi:hypothetical protein